MRHSCCCVSAPPMIDARGRARALVACSCLAPALSRSSLFLDSSAPIDRTAAPSLAVNGANVAAQVHAASALAELSNCHADNQVHAPVTDCHSCLRPHRLVATLLLAPSLPPRCFLIWDQYGYLQTEPSTASSFVPPRAGCDREGRWDRAAACDAWQSIDLGAGARGACTGAPLARPRGQSGDDRTYGRTSAAGTRDTCTSCTYLLHAPPARRPPPAWASVLPCISSILTSILTSTNTRCMPPGGNAREWQL